MKFIPEFTLSWWNGFFLIIPFLLIRFGLMSLVGKESVKRADYFPPLIGAEKTAFKFYILTGYLVMLYLPFLSIKINTVWFWFGVPLYLGGLIILALSILGFSKANDSDFARKGIYRVSRNPMYFAYMLFYAACGLMTASWLYLLFVFVRTVSEYWIVLSEERWAKEKYGEPYQEYCSQVRRYLGRKV